MNTTAYFAQTAIVLKPPAPTVVDRVAGYVLPAIVPLAVLLVWLLAVRLAWAPTQILPGPGDVLAALRDALASGELLHNVGRTLLWLLGGYLISVVVGIALGIAMGTSQTVTDYLYPSFKAISYVPVLGWLPLWLVLLGVGDALKVVLVAQAAFSPIVLNAYAGVRGVPTSLIELGRVTRLGRFQMLVRIILLSAFPAIWSGIRFGMTKAWLALVAVELLASTEGLGFMMVNARNLFQLDMMFVSAIAIGVVGFALDRGFEAIERRVLRWREVAEG